MLWIKRRFEPRNSLGNTYKDMYGKPFKCDWVAKDVSLIQILLTLRDCCNRYFWDIRLKIYRLPNCPMGRMSGIILRLWGFLWLRDAGGGADVTKSLGEGKRKSWRLTIFLIITSFTGIACREPMQRREAYKQRWNHVEMLAWMLLHVIESPWPVNSKIHFRAFWNFLTNIMDGSCSSP